MAYTKTTWTNDSGEAISADNLNKIETGIYDNDANITAVSDTVDACEKKTLIWTNANPSSAFAGQSVTGTTTYDAYDVEYVGYTGQATTIFTTRLSNSNGALIHITGGTGAVAGAFYVFKRNMWKVTNGVSFGGCYSSSAGGSWASYSAETGCVPYRIWGVTESTATE